MPLATPRASAAPETSPTRCSAPGSGATASGRPASVWRPTCECSPAATASSKRGRYTHTTIRTYVRIDCVRIATVGYLHGDGGRGLITLQQKLCYHRYTDRCWRSNTDPDRHAGLGFAQSIVSGPSAEPLRNWRTNGFSEENILAASPASTMRPRHSSAMYSPIWRAEAMLCVTTR
jgi:hypothetical protein